MESNYSNGKYLLFLDVSSNFFLQNKYSNSLFVLFFQNVSFNYEKFFEKDKNFKIKKKIREKESFE